LQATSEFERAPLLVLQAHAHGAQTAQREIDGAADPRLACLTLGDSGVATILELGQRAQRTIGDLYERLSEHAAKAKRRAATEVPVPGGPLLLDAAFLVPAGKSARFRSLVSREARTLGRQGYHVTLTGPWPPYTFVQD